MATPGADTAWRILSEGPPKNGSITRSFAASTALSIEAGSQGWATAVGVGRSCWARSTSRRNFWWSSVIMAVSGSGGGGNGRRPRPPPLLVLELPAAAERLVEIDDGDELRLPGPGELVLGRKQLLLGLEYLEIACAAALVAEGRQVDRAAQRGDLGLERGAAGREGLLGDERVRRLLEGDQHRLAVARRGFVPDGFALRVDRFEPAAGEQWAEQIGAAAPEAEGPVDAAV